MERKVKETVKWVEKDTEGRIGQREVSGTKSVGKRRGN